MYENHFGIRKKPFSIAPDPKFLYMSDGHREALAHLRYGLENDGGFVLLTGEVGTGKTTVCRCLLEQVPDDADIAYILTPKVTALELLETICDELEIRIVDERVSVKTLVDAINKHLLQAHAAGRRTVLIIDEAQNLETEVLEQVRLLTNLETNQQKLLQIILLGQPELHDKLNSRELYQLSQRISARHHLAPLNKKETKAYVLHRLSVAGLSKQVFSEESYDKLYKLAGGIPRLINVIGDRALLGAFSKEKSQVDKKTVENAAKEVFGEKVQKGSGILSLSPRKIAASTLSVALLILGVIFFLSEREGENTGGGLGPFEMEANAQGIEVKKKGSGEALATPKWPAGEETYLTEEIAFQNVFSLWGIEYNPEGQWPCQYAEQQGLYCLSEQDSIEHLIRLNRPAVLLMRNKQGEEFYIALREISGREAFFELGQKSYRISLDDIALDWTGRYTILWQPPPGYKDSIRPGREGKEVAWLSRQLAVIYDDKDDRSQETTVFNDGLVNKVRLFQFENGLVSDGIAGKETLIMVNSKAGNKVPLLRK